MARITFRQAIILVAICRFFEKNGFYPKNEEMWKPNHGGAVNDMIRELSAEVSPQKRTLIQRLMQTPSGFIGSHNTTLREFKYLRAAELLEPRPSMLPTPKGKYLAKLYLAAMQDGKIEIEYRSMLTQEELLYVTTTE